ncbi:hypothetical protein GC167_09455 [bacterium]|nr:hypothetical protein [bacterium]
MNQASWITVSTELPAPPEVVWFHYTQPESIVHWNQASDDWHCPEAHNALEEGGRFEYTMASRDGAHRFVFGGVFGALNPPFSMDYVMDDGRKVEVRIKALPEGSSISVRFEPESVHSLELQQQGWQAILDSFQRFVARFS